MTKRHRRSRKRAGGRTLRRFAAAALIFLIPIGLGADSLNLTTWYPAPYGVYTTLRSTRDAYFAYQSGNVGIGTASPQHILDVAGADAQMVVTGTDQTLGGAVWVRNDLGQTLWLSNNGSTRLGTRYSLPRANMQLIEAQNANYFVIGTNGAFPLVLGTAQTERMRIAGSGNVGIGTTRPGTSLDVVKSGPWEQAALEIENQANNVPGVGTSISFSVGTPGINEYEMARIAGLREGASGTQGALEFYTGNVTLGSPAQAMYINSSQNVGIGTTSPAARLQVGNSGDGSVALANAWNTFSSRRFKENVHPIGGALGKINRLRGVEFQWKGSGKRDLGVVAEEVGQVFPEIVDYETGGRDARGLDYSKLVAPLIEAVKEQQDEILAQQRQIKSQSARIEALEKTLVEVHKK